MAHEYFKDLNKRTANNKVLRDKEFNIAKNPKYDGYKHGCGSWFIKFLIKKTSGGTVKIKLCKIKSKLKNYINQLLKILRKEK